MAEEQKKMCWYCNSLFPASEIAGHEASCPKNPDNNK